MDRNLVVILVIILSCFIMLAPIRCGASKNKLQEGFYSYNNYFKQYCPSCRWRSRYSCGKCTNCGLCGFNDGSTQCVPGDSSGPYGRENCDFWEYGDPYMYYPNSNLFPIIKTKSMFPYKKPIHNIKWAGGFNYGKDS